MVKFSIEALQAVGFGHGRINHPKKEGFYLLSGKTKLTWKVERRIKGSHKTHKNTLGTFMDSKRSIILKPDDAYRMASLEINLCDQGIDPKSTHTETDDITVRDILYYHLNTNCSEGTHEKTRLLIRRLEEDWNSPNSVQDENILAVTVRKLRKSHVRQVYKLFQPFGPRSCSSAVEKLSAAITIYNEGELTDDTAFLNYALRFSKKDMDPAPDPELHLFDDESAGTLMETIIKKYNASETTFIQKNAINAILLMLHTGVRGNEALKIEIDRIENNSYTYAPHENKGRRTRVVYFSRQAEQIIERQKELLKTRKHPITQSHLLFQGQTGKFWLKHINDLLHGLGYDQTSHSIRHYHNSVGQELGTISQRLLEVMHGHSSGRNVNEKVYTHFQEKAIRLAFQKISDAVESVYLKRTDPSITPDIVAGWRLAEEFLDLSDEGKRAFFERACLVTTRPEPNHQTRLMQTTDRLQITA